MVDIPQKPPLEIVKSGQIWVIEEYKRGKRTGKTFSTHDSQMDAVRSAKAKMDEDKHPCTVRWEAEDSVTNIYWNPLYETVALRYDELLDAWSIVPEAGTCAIEIHEDWKQAHERAKEVQRTYNFKSLRAYNFTGDDYEEREHRFLRYDITQSGVRFDRAAVEAQPDPEEESEEVEPATSESATETEVDGVTVTKPATPGMLGVSIPDVTKVEFLDTDGLIHRYATPWGDGTNAQIVAIAQKYAAHEGLREAFNRHVTAWEASVDCQSVTSIYEQGTAPTAWVAYRAGEHSLWEIGHDLPIDDRRGVIEDVAMAIEEVSLHLDGVCGIRPENIRLWNVRGRWRVGVANWGIDWAVHNELPEAEHVTAFSAPEQLAGELTATTSVYQLGMVATWLLCEQLPVDPDEPDAVAIREGTLRLPSPTTGVPSSVSTVLQRALETDPANRYADPTAFVDALRQRLEG